MTRRNRPPQTKLQAELEADARQYLDRGLSTVPLNDKKPTVMWKPFQTQPTDAELSPLVSVRRRYGGCCSHLQASGALAIRDFDTNQDTKIGKGNIHLRRAPAPRPEPNGDITSGATPIFSEQLSWGMENTGALESAFRPAHFTSKAESDIAGKSRCRRASYPLSSIQFSWVTESSLPLLIAIQRYTQAILCLSLSLSVSVLSPFPMR